MNINCSVFKVNWNFYYYFEDLIVFHIELEIYFLALISILFYLNFYINCLLLPFSSITSIFGFVLLLAIMMQSYYLVFFSMILYSEPGLVIELREEMFEETVLSRSFCYACSWVDVIFVFSYFHILKKFI